MQIPIHLKPSDEVRSIHDNIEACKMGQQAWQNVAFGDEKNACGANKEESSSCLMDLSSSKFLMPSGKRGLHPQGQVISIFLINRLGHTESNSLLLELIHGPLSSSTNALRQLV